MSVYFDNSDEGNCSSSSDNEGKHSITALDLEGPCCAPIRAPPSSPDIMHEIRKFRVRRMHKVMRFLDQVYFSPVLQRKFKALARLKRRRHRIGGKSASSKQLTEGEGGASLPCIELSEKLDIGRLESGQIAIKALVTDSESSDSLRSQSSDTITTVSNDVTPSGKHQCRKRNKNKKYMPTEKGKDKPYNPKMRINRNLRLWLANRRIFIFRRKKLLAIMSFYILMFETTLGPYFTTEKSQIS